MDGRMDVGCCYVIHSSIAALPMVIFLSRAYPAAVGTLRKGCLPRALRAIISNLDTTLQGQVLPSIFQSCVLDVSFAFTLLLSYPKSLMASPEDKCLPLEPIHGPFLVDVVRLGATDGVAFVALSFQALLWCTLMIQSGPSVGSPRDFIAVIISSTLFRPPRLVGLF